MERLKPRLPYRVLEESEAQALARRLEDISTEAYRGSGGEAVLKKHLLKEEYDYFMQYFADEGIDVTHTQALQDFIGQAGGELAQFEVVVLRMAFSLRYEFLLEVLAWFEQNTSKQSRIKIVFDVNTIGGFVLEYGGKIYDYSLRKDLESRESNSKSE